MADYFYSLQALISPWTIDDTPDVDRGCCCLVCGLADEENQ